jgi:hypothetical protein
LLLAVREQELMGALAVAVNVTTVPGGPEIGEKGGTVNCADAGVGIRIAETEKISADASRSTRYREPTRRVINSKHATWISWACTI